MAARTLDELYDEMKGCNACALRGGCTQVVTHEGQTMNPILLIIGESPGADEDREGRPFIGKSGQLLRNFLRENGLNRDNTLISNTIHCRPPANKFPTAAAIPRMCVSMWMQREIEIGKPERILIVGGQALKYVAGMEGIMTMRGTWIKTRGIRALPTYHPSYVLRQENSGDPAPYHCLESDIREMAQEVLEIERARGQIQTT